LGIFLNIIYSGNYKNNLRIDEVLDIISSNENVFFPIETMKIGHILSQDSPFDQLDS